ncbi:MAG TPA: hypothetical protein VIK33_07460 [Anaerolineae bacterium]
MKSPTALTERRRAELEAVACELLEMHGVDRPPVPIEDILRRPAADLWRPDLVDLSVQSFDANERYAVRPTIARLVARYAAETVWARRRGWVGAGGLSTDEIHYLGRALLMPKPWMAELSAGERTPSSVRVHFHVPVPDAAKRLIELLLVE